MDGLYTGPSGSATHMLRKLRAKSTEKYVVFFAVLAGVVVVSLSLTSAEEDENPVVGFYVERGQHAFETRSPIVTGTTFSLKTRSYYKRIGEHGAVQSVDSAVITYYYSWGKLDSSRVISGDASRFKSVDLSYPDVFARDYRFYLFPNDVGGPELAIGFDTRTEQETLPEGLILIDREQYYPLWLYLYYPVKSGRWAPNAAYFSANTIGWKPASWRSISSGSNGPGSLANQNLTACHWPGIAVRARVYKSC
jgi:hypothetical protein